MTYRVDQSVINEKDVQKFYILLFEHFRKIGKLKKEPRKI